MVRIELHMNENTMQIVAALVLVNLVAWGGYVALDDDPEIVYKYREPVSYTHLRAHET